MNDYSTDHVVFNLMLQENAHHTIKKKKKETNKQEQWHKITWNKLALQTKLESFWNNEVSFLVQNWGEVDHVIMSTNDARIAVASWQIIWNKK